MTNQLSESQRRERDLLVANLYVMGYSIREISAETGLHRANVYRALARRRLAPNRHPNTRSPQDRASA